MRLRCANCRRALLTVDNPLTSQLYGTYGAVSLCGECSEYEKARINKAHTNSIPELLQIYVSATGSTVPVKTKEST